MFGGRLGKAGTLRGGAMMPICKKHRRELVPGPGGKMLCVECWVEGERMKRCPKSRTGLHRWVPYVERNPHRRGTECKFCGYRPPEPPALKLARALAR